MHTNPTSEGGAPIKQDVITSSSDVGRAQKLLYRYLKREFSARAIKRYHFPVARSMLRSFHFFFHTDFHCPLALTKKRRRSARTASIRKVQTSA